jgi:DNA-directed RNA polymerase subunit L
MQTYVVEKTENSLKVGFKDVNISIIAPLIKVLDNNKNVKIARFIEKHPELEDRMIYIEMNSGNPEEALKNAFEEISNYYSNIKE